MWADKRIRSRLTTLSAASIPKDFLERVQAHDPPPELIEALNMGKLLIDPMPCLDEALGPNSLDLRLGYKLEVPDTPLEVAAINKRTVIRRLTFDPLYPPRDNRLDQRRRVSMLDGRACFFLEDGEAFELQPGMLLIAHALEVVCVPFDTVMHLWGKSWFARHGIAAHITTPLFHAGWCGNPVLELENHGRFSMNISPGIPIAQVTFHELTDIPDRPYLAMDNVKFSGQR